MSEQTGDAVPEWNPLATVEPVVEPLRASGGRASVTYRRWTGRERLAYEDAITERLMTKDQHDEETVKLGTLRLFAVSLTVVGSSGFPPRADGSPFLSGSREQREADLLAITDPDTFAEIRDTATRIQPLPTADAGDRDETPAGGAEGNRFPTGSTPPDGTPPVA